MKYSQPVRIAVYHYTRSDTYALQIKRGDSVTWMSIEWGVASVICDVYDLKMEKRDY